jgi:hypothetical protein
MFTEQLTRAIAAARTPQLDHLSAAGTEAVRAARSRTRRRLHEPRPTATPEINARIGQWKNNIKAACLAGYIGQSYDKYLHELLTISSVARGDYCLYSDKEMAQRLNLRGDGSRTVRRHRAAATKQGLLEVLGHGKDRKPCMVRPVLPDGSPVFLSRPELAGRSDTFVRLTRTTLAADLLLTDTLKTEDYPPFPPAVPDGPEEGGRVFDRVEDEEPAKPAESGMFSSETAGVADQVPAPTQPPSSKNAPAGSAAAPPATQPGPDVIEPAKPVMPFLEFWLAMGQTGVRAMPGPSGASYRRPTKRRSETG